MLDMETILVAIWLTVWVGATIFAAAVIGYIPNYPDEKEPSFPAFVWPLFFGWTWPGVAALALIIQPLIWLANHAARRAALAQRTGCEPGADVILWFDAKNRELQDAARTAALSAKESSHD